jgi:outer membrane protein TolC
MRAEAGLALAAILSGCAPLAHFTSPEGDGGWSAARRAEEIGKRAQAAGVAFVERPAPAVPAGPLDLPTALRLAARGNRRIALAATDLDVAREQVAEARGRLLPSTTGTGRFTRYTDQQTTSVVLPPGLLPPGTAAPDVIVRDIQAGVFNGTVAVPLDLSGELRHALRAAQAGYRGERARVWATTLEQQVAVIRAYFDLLEAERLRGVTEQTIESQREQLATAQARYDSGRLTKNELLVVQVTLRNEEQRLLQRQLEIDQARWTLNQAVGLDVDAPTEPADVSERPEVPSVEEALREAYARNPVLASLVEEQQRLDETARALAASRLPRFSGGGAIDYTTSAILQPQRVGSGFVGFSWDFGTDGQREARIAEARLEVERNRTEIERDLRELEASVRSTQQAAEERLAALATAKAAVGQAEENLRIRRQQFDAGRAQSEDVLGAEVLLAGQRATLATALYQAHTRRAELEQLMGGSLETLVSEER